MQEYRVMMFIGGVEVPSSAIANGTLDHCNGVAKRLNASKNKHASVSWAVLPCIQAPR
jgi:hypothetical protein